VSRVWVRRPPRARVSVGHAAIHRRRGGCGVESCRDCSPVRVVCSVEWAATCGELSCRGRGAQSGVRRPHPLRARGAMNSRSDALPGPPTRDSLSAEIRGLGPRTNVWTSELGWARVSARAWGPRAFLTAATVRDAGSRGSLDGDPGHPARCGIRHCSVTSWRCWSAVSSRTTSRRLRIPAERSALVLERRGSVRRSPSSREAESARPPSTEPVRGGDRPAAEH
jgi:hypothetical protein